MAKKVKVKKTLVQQILTKAGINHTGIQINALEGEMPQGYEKSQIFKTLALLGDKTGPIIGILPITEHLSEKKLAKISGNKKVSMIPQKDLEKTTGYIHGANNPVGIRQKHNYPIFIDQTALQLKEMIVSAGEVGHSIIINPQDLATFVKAEFADMDGWSAEANASSLLQGLGIGTELHEKIKSVLWLENFLMDYEGTVIVVSHDRYFLNNICTHMVDIDFKKIKVFVGNYDFWYESSQLAAQMLKDQNKKKEDKIKELQNFIARFSANKSKSKQATSRKKLLDKIQVEDIQPSTRRYPFVGFEMEREVGNQILEVNEISKTIEGRLVLDKVSFMVNRNDKIGFIGDELAITTLFKILAGELEPDSGDFKWGVTTSRSYFPKDNTEFFKDTPYNLIDWLRQFSTEQSEIYIRGFLGRMLFSGDEALKPAQKLSGGEKVRMMLSYMMLKNSNVLILDQPTNHLDLESIISLNNGLKAFKGNILFASHDTEFMNTIANRIIHIEDNIFEDRLMTYQEYIDRFVEGQ